MKQHSMTCEENTSCIINIVLHNIWLPDSNGLLNGYKLCNDCVITYQSDHTLTYEEDTYNFMENFSWIYVNDKCNFKVK